MENSKFEKEVMLYLRNLAAKFHHLSQKVIELKQIMYKGFRATGTAFNQTKDVVNALAKATEETRLDLAEYGGVIEADSFF